MRTIGPEVKVEFPSIDVQSKIPEFGFLGHVGGGWTGLTASSFEYSNEREEPMKASNWLE